MYKIIQCLNFKKANLPIIRRMSCKPTCKISCIPTYDCKRPNKKEPDDESYRSICHPYLVCKKTKDPKIFKTIFFFICVPLILLCLADIFIMNPEERERPEFVKYEYLRIRKKGFPWDPVRTLFHHPYYNALPDGYETPDRYETESNQSD